MCIRKLDVPYTDMVNVVLDLKLIRLKYMVETINYNKVDPVNKWARIFIAVATIKNTFSFIKSLEFRNILFGLHI